MLRLSFVGRYLYQVCKPRVLSERNKSYREYKKALKDARTKIHIEAKEYQQEIQNQYLAKHHEEMKKFHFDNECSFRKHVFVSSYRFAQDLQILRKKDDVFLSKVSKYMHDEDIKKINRHRIIKIMEHESENFWFNSENANTRLQNETIFPEYIASTEYYYRLHAEALAYEKGELDMVSLYASTEYGIKEKNKILMPIYADLTRLISQYKRSDIENLQRVKNNKIIKINGDSSINAEAKKELIAKANQIYVQEKKKILAEIQTQAGRSLKLKKKIVDLIKILNLWKSYTNILGMTSIELLANKEKVKNESIHTRNQSQILKSLSQKKKSSFISSLEEDTEELSQSFEQYVAKIKQEKKQGMLDDQQHQNILEVDQMIKSVNANQTVPGTISLNKSNSINIQSFLQSEEPARNNSNDNFLEELKGVNPQFLNPQQTTSSVEILKQIYKDDQQFIQILNVLGEIDLRYPKLFEKIWEQIKT